MLKFITGNKNKFEEAQQILFPIKIQRVHIDLDEIQEIDPQKIIRHKLNEAFRHDKGLFIVEDSSLTMGALGGKLPGPFIKWFIEHLGLKKLSQLAKKSNNLQAEETVVVAFAKNPKNITFFRGKNVGKIVAPRGSYGFGYDKFFQPLGSKFTHGELKAKDNFSKTARSLAFKKLKKYLEDHE